MTIDTPLTLPELRGLGTAGARIRAFVIGVPQEIEIEDGAGGVRSIPNLGLIAERYAVGQNVFWFATKADLDARLAQGSPLPDDTALQVLEDPAHVDETNEINGRYIVQNGVATGPFLDPGAAEARRAINDLIAGAPDEANTLAKLSALVNLRQKAEEVAAGYAPDAAVEALSAAQQEAVFKGTLLVEPSGSVLSYSGAGDKAARQSWVTVYDAPAQAAARDAAIAVQADEVRERVRFVQAVANLAFEPEPGALAFQDSAFGDTGALDGDYPSYSDGGGVFEVVGMTEATALADDYVSDDALETVGAGAVVRSASGAGRERVAIALGFTHDLTDTAIARLEPGRYQALSASLRPTRIALTGQMGAERPAGRISGYWCLGQSGSLNIVGPGASGQPVWQAFLEHSGAISDRIKMLGSSIRSYDGSSTAPNYSGQTFGPATAEVLGTNPPADGDTVAYTGPHMAGAWVLAEAGGGVPELGLVDVDAFGRGSTSWLYHLASVDGGDGWWWDNVFVPRVAAKAAAATAAGYTYEYVLIDMDVGETDHGDRKDRAWVKDKAEKWGSRVESHIKSVLGANVTVLICFNPGVRVYEEAPNPAPPTGSNRFEISQVWLAYGDLAHSRDPSHARFGWTGNNTDCTVSGPSHFTGDFTGYVQKRARGAWRLREMVAAHLQGRKMRLPGLSVAGDGLTLEGVSYGEGGRLVCIPLQIEDPADYVEIDARVDAAPGDGVPPQLAHGVEFPDWPALIDQPWIENDQVLCARFASPVTAQGRVRVAFSDTDGLDGEQSREGGWERDPNTPAGTLEHKSVRTNLRIQSGKYNPWTLEPLPDYLPHGSYIAPGPNG